MDTSHLPPASTLSQSGDKDPVVPMHQSELLAEALKKAGVKVAFPVVPGGEHGGAQFRKREELDRLFVFFERTLKGARGGAGYSFSSSQFLVNDKPNAE